MAPDTCQRLPAAPKSIAPTPTVARAAVHEPTAPIASATDLVDNTRAERTTSRRGLAEDCAAVTPANRPNGTTHDTTSRKVPLDSSDL